MKGILNGSILIIFMSFYKGIYTFNMIFNKQIGILELYKIKVLDEWLNWCGFLGRRWGIGILSFVTFVVWKKNVHSERNYIMLKNNFHKFNDGGHSHTQIFRCWHILVFLKTIISDYIKNFTGFEF